MGLWAFYFLGKVYLYYRGYIRFDFLLNLLFALFLVIPIPQKLPARRFLRGVRFIVAVAAAFLLLWHETWFPPLLRTVRLLSETGGVSPAYIIRFLRDSVNITETGILILIFAICLFLNRKVVLTPLALAAIISVPLLAAKSGTANVDNYIEQFYHTESKRVVSFTELHQGSPVFDIIILHI
jgi:uncharacterized membrane protein